MSSSLVEQPGSRKTAESGYSALVRVARQAATARDTDELR